MPLSTRFSLCGEFAYDFIVRSITRKVGRLMRIIEFIIKFRARRLLLQIMPLRVMSAGGADAAA